MITNGKKSLEHAFKNGYAIPHFNILDANYVKNVVLTANKMKSPVIIAISGRSIEFIGGFKTFSNIVRNIDDEYKVDVPVIIHLDHGTYEQCLKAIASGFSSVMYDGSKLPISENILKIKEILSKASKLNISVEGEVGSIGGEEDGVIGEGVRANVKDCIEMSKTGISSLAAGINTIHGKYPKDWKGVDFELLDKIKASSNIPLVLHGGSGIPTNQIKKSISKGISKINVGTNLQVAFGEGVLNYFNNLKDSKDKKWYDPRKIVNSGFKNVNEVVKNSILMMGSKDVV